MSGTKIRFLGELEGSIRALAIAAALEAHAVTEAEDADLVVATPASYRHLLRTYAREKIPHRTRQFVTVAALTVLERTEELKLHLHGALNVGCPPREVAEVIFQMATYGGVPVVNSALKVFRTVLQEKGLWPLK
jgi:alkylhydroperoxidase/carboxymuconolactone decarboxylase family protein YurZ